MGHTLATSADRISTYALVAGQMKSSWWPCGEFCQAVVTPGPVRSRRVTRVVTVPEWKPAWVAAGGEVGIAEAGRRDPVRHFSSSLHVTGTQVSRRRDLLVI